MATARQVPVVEDNSEAKLDAAADQMTEMMMPWFMSLPKEEQEAFVRDVKAIPPRVSAKSHRTA